MNRARLAADIGGTFTDVVLEHAGRRLSAKVLTTPRAPEEGMLEGIARVLAAASLAPGRRRPTDPRHHARDQCADRA